MTVHMRSLDAVYGYNADYIWFDWIFNKAVQYLKETYKDLERGDMVIYADSVHVYEKHYEDLNKEANFGAKEKSYFEVLAEREKNNKLLISSTSANIYLNDPENNANEELNDPMVNHPKHYNNNNIEHWDYVEDIGYGYLLGCATKYVFRNRHKGSKIKDLNKVVSYCKKFISKVNYKNKSYNTTSVEPYISQLNDIVEYERDLLYLINQLNNSRNHESSNMILDKIIKVVEDEKRR